MKKNFKKSILVFLCVVILSTLIEIIIFNFSYLNDKFIKKVKTTYCQEDNISYVNWQESTDTQKVSLVDSMIILNNLNTKISKVKIDVNLNENVKVPYTDIFYTTQEIGQFNGDLVIHDKNKYDKSIEININKDVKDLRIDLGDQAGLILNDIKIIINPLDFHISISRIVTMIIIYYLSIFLFSLQRNPNYQLDNKEEK